MLRLFGQRFFILIILFLLIGSLSVLAECTLNGEVIPCGEVGNMIGLFFASFSMMILVMMLLGLLSFVFWIWMLIDCLNNNNLHGEHDKLVWILLMVFTGALGSILYFFLVKVNKNSKSVGRKRKVVRRKSVNRGK